MSTRDLAWLNALGTEEARAELIRCCGCVRWAESMLEARPFGSVEALHRAADEAWARCGAPEYREAFAHHPRIGDARAAAGPGWASGEQKGALDAGSETRAKIAEGNQRYEAKFGHIYLVCATGKSAEELLSILESRLDNDAETELRIAASEQLKITHLRLEKLLSP